MANKTFDVILLLLCILPLGFDKLYKKDVAMFLWKLISFFVVVGVVWWIYDIVCASMGKYKINPFK